MNSRRLLNALKILLPGSTLAVVNETPWYSLTFVGLQIGISVIFSTQENADCAERFTSELPNHEFNLSGQLVADISATLEATGGDTKQFVIDALLLED